MLKKYWVLAGVLMLVLIHGSHAIKRLIKELQCYQCVYCQDPFNPAEANIINCTGSCEKAQRNKDVVRLCYPKSALDHCKIQGEDNGPKHDACLCHTDLCNGAITSVSTIMLTFSMTFGIFLSTVMM